MQSNTHNPRPNTAHSMRPIFGRHSAVRAGGRRNLLLAFLLCILASPIRAQWDLQDSHTTASLRGIHNVGGGVAWASGTNGAVLRTEDGGYLWQSCARLPKPNTSTSMAYRPSTRTPPSSCPQAKETSPASTKPLTAANPGNSSSPTQTKTAFGTRLGLIQVPHRITPNRMVLEC